MARETSWAASGRGNTVGGRPLNTSLDCMPITVDHPVLMAVVAIACAPMLFLTARWFFDDLETFLDEIGYRAHDDIWWKLIRTGQFTSLLIWYKVVGFVGSYVIVVYAFYASIGRLMK